MRCGPHGPRSCKNYAKHYQTGEPIPQALLDKVDAAKKFNQGYATTELVAANVIDQAWHQLKAADVPDAAGVNDFEAAALKKAGLDFGPVPPRYRSTYFSHIFAGGYSAGYYSYFWSEVLDAATVEWIKTHGGLTRKNLFWQTRTISDRRAGRDNNAMMPPSPRLSARRIKVMYLTDTTIMSAQKMSEMTPTTLLSLTASPWVGSNTVFMTYSGLVPISP